MAVDWKFEITSVNTETGRADVRAIRTDHESVEEPCTFTMSNTPFATPQDRQSVLETLKGWQVQKELLASATKDFIAGFDATAKVTMESWEVDRIAGE